MGILGAILVFGFFVLFYLEIKIHQYYWGQELC